MAIHTVGSCGGSASRKSDAPIPAEFEANDTRAEPRHHLSPLTARAAAASRA